VSGRRREGAWVVALGQRGAGEAVTAQCRSRGEGERRGRDTSEQEGGGGAEYLCTWQLIAVVQACCLIKID
jgi:hypothetical protein